MKRSVRQAASIRDAMMVLLLALGTWHAAAANARAQSPIPARLTLADALRIASERNPDLEAARSAVDAARGDRTTASQRPNPTFGFESVGRPPGARPPGLDDHEYVFQLTQELETAGRRGLRTAVAESALDVARSTAADVRRRIDLDVRRAYFRVALARADRDVANTTLAEIEQVIALNRARFDQGEISGGELRRTQVERLRFMDDVFAGELTLRNARAALLALLAAPDLAQPFEAVEPLAPEANDAALAQALDTRVLREQAFTTRPDLRAAAQAVQQAEAETRLQRALGRPTVTVGGGYSHLGGIDTAAFAVSIPLMIFNRNPGGIARAVAERRLAESRRVAAALAVSLDVQQAANAVDLSRARVQAIREEFLTPSRESRDIILASYRLGDADLIDLLDAQRAYRDTQRTYNRALFDQRLSLIELAAAVEPVREEP